mmetsp:Transcript_52489/g.146297  ORF Transcript_52489/g.146297 Transcript_52489/m.146297 type:complete len:295 (+) Transcript_52489:86-970(+)
MADLGSLNTVLAAQSYIGGTPCATLEDYKVCKGIAVGSIDFATFPHLARWHSHVSYLAEKYPSFDYRGEPVPAGKAGTASAPKKEAAQKKDAAPNKEAAPKEAGPEQREPTPEELEKMRKDKLKKVIKEGGKRGVEIEGAADMGGLQFFCCSVDVPEGDLDMLKESMLAMNAKSDPTEEERKGGSGHIGKMIFSAGSEQLAVVAYVPEAKQGELSCEEWLKTVLSSQGGQIVSSAADISMGTVKTNADKGVFPLKIREPMILEANNFLRKKGLFPDNDDDDDDDYVFGDDDFPS